MYYSVALLAIPVGMLKFLLAPFLDVRPKETRFSVDLCLKTPILSKNHLRSRISRIPRKNCPKTTSGALHPYTVQTSKYRPKRTSGAKKKALKPAYWRVKTGENPYDYWKFPRNFSRIHRFSKSRWSV